LASLLSTLLLASALLNKSLLLVFTYLVAPVRWHLKRLPNPEHVPFKEAPGNGRRQEKGAACWAPDLAVGSKCVYFFSAWGGE